MLKMNNDTCSFLNASWMSFESKIFTLKIQMIHIIGGKIDSSLPIRCQPLLFGPNENLRMWENTLRFPDRSHTPYTNHSMIQNYSFRSRWIFDSFAIGEITQTFVVGRKINNVLRNRKIDRSELTTAKSVSNRCEYGQIRSSFHWSLCEGNCQNHSHLVAIVGVDLETDRVCVMPPHTHTPWPDLQFRCVVHVQSKAFQFFFLSFS